MSGANVPSPDNPYRVFLTDTLLQQGTYFDERVDFLVQERTEVPLSAYLNDKSGERDRDFFPRVEASVINLQKTAGNGDNQSSSKNVLKLSKRLQEVLLHGVCTAESQPELLSRLNRLLFSQLRRCNCFEEAFVRVHRRQDEQDLSIGSHLQERIEPPLEVQLFLKPLPKFFYRPLFISVGDKSSLRSESNALIRNHFGFGERVRFSGALLYSQYALRQRASLRIDLPFALWHKAPETAQSYELAIKAFYERASSNSLLHKNTLKLKFSDAARPQSLTLAYEEAKLAQLQAPVKLPPTIDQMTDSNVFSVKYDVQPLAATLEDEPNTTFIRQSFSTGIDARNNWFLRIHNHLNYLQHFQIITEQRNYILSLRNTFQLGAIFVQQQQSHLPPSSDHYYLTDKTPFGFAQVSAPRNKQGAAIMLQNRTLLFFNDYPFARMFGIVPFLHASFYLQPIGVLERQNTQFNSSEQSSRSQSRSLLLRLASRSLFSAGVGLVREVGQSGNIYLIYNLLAFRGDNSQVQDAFCKFQILFEKK